MARSQQIVDTLKQELRTHGINYRVLAEKLDLSESTIKHMFSTKNFSLKRLDKICEILNMELTDLVEQYEKREPKLEQLTLENERILVSDMSLLLVAYCVTTHWSIDDILRTYTITETECIACLAKLDKMKLIELLPENRVRLLVSNNFKWHNNGPIDNFFKKEAQKHFFTAPFDGSENRHLVKIGDLSIKSIHQVIERMESVGDFYEEMYQEDRKQPWDRRHGTTMILAIRKWEFAAFDEFLR